MVEPIIQLHLQTRRSQVQASTPSIQGPSPERQPRPHLRLHLPNANPLREPRLRHRLRGMVSTAVVNVAQPELEKRQAQGGTWDPGLRIGFPMGNQAGIVPRLL